MTTHTTPRAVLVAARALIDTPEKWTQGAYQRDVRGRKCKPSDVVSRCSEAAMIAVADGAAWHIYDAAYDLLRTAMDGLNLEYWQDAPGRTHADVMDAFDRAIAAAGES